MVVWLDEAEDADDVRAIGCGWRVILAAAAGVARQIAIPARRNAAAIVLMGPPSNCPDPSHATTIAIEIGFKFGGRVLGYFEKK